MDNRDARQTTEKLFFHDLHDSGVGNKALRYRRFMRKEAPRYGEKDRF